MQEKAECLGQKNKERKRGKKKEQRVKWGKRRKINNVNKIGEVRKEN
jgi:hypothetical protein